MLIDFEATKLYFKNLNQVMSNDAFILSVSTLAEMMEQFAEDDGESKNDPAGFQQNQLMCTRGVLLLLANEALSNYNA